MLSGDFLELSIDYTKFWIPFIFINSLKEIMIKFSILRIKYLVNELKCVRGSQFKRSLFKISWLGLQFCVHDYDFVYMITNSCTWLRFRVHDYKFVYMITISCTWLQFRGHDYNFVYWLQIRVLITISCTWLQFRLHDNNFVKMITISCTD